MTIIGVGLNCSSHWLSHPISGVTDDAVSILPDSGWPTRPSVRTRDSVRMPTWRQGTGRPTVEVAYWGFGIIGSSGTRYRIIIVVCLLASCTSLQNKRVSSTFCPTHMHPWSHASKCNGNNSPIMHPKRPESADSGS